MEERNLRPGNYFHYKSGEDIQEIRIQGDKLNLYNVTNRGGIHKGYSYDINPIPLSPYYMELLGFHQIDDHMEDIGRSAWEIVIRGSRYRFYLNTKYGKENPNCGIIGIYYPQEELPLPTEDNLDATIHQDESWTGFAWGKKYVHELQDILHVIS